MTDTATIQVYHFQASDSALASHTPEELKENPALLPTPTDDRQIWVNIDGTVDKDLVRLICKHYKVHHLLIEDILTHSQRPKLEEYDNDLAIITQVLSWKNGHLATEQLSMILFDGLLLTFQEKPSRTPLFDPIRKRITEGAGRTRRSKVDYLMVSILDAIVDHNLLMSESLEEEAERHEESLLTHMNPNTLKQIYKLRMKVTNLRQKTRPTREMVKTLIEGEHNMLEQQSILHLREVHDNTLRIADRIESIREMLVGMGDLYSSQTNNRLSEIMKFLTMISAVFVPLNLIAAIYGMNFKNMPELNFKYMYFIILSVMAMIAGGMLYYFKKKEWL